MTLNKRSSLRSRLMAWLIGASVPVLNLFRRPKPFPYSLAELRTLPPNTLGAATAAFLDKRHFDFLPQYETHDVIHTLLGYGTTTTGELRLQAFMWGNRSSSIAGRVLFLLGILTLPELWPQLKKDYARGRQAQRLAQIDIPALLPENIERVRHQLGVGHLAALTYDHPR